MPNEIVRSKKIQEVIKIKQKRYKRLSQLLFFYRYFMIAAQKNMNEIRDSQLKWLACSTTI